MSETIVVTTERGGTYPVVIGEGVAVRLPDELPGQFSSVALIADSNLARLHVPRLRAALGDSKRVVVVEFPAGEPNKNRQTKARIEDAMLEAGLGRDCTVVAVGGGVTTDLGGFVAATFMRGVPWIAVPTSLLGAVDASVGGKTGVNTGSGKNLIGAFYQPRAVLIDLELMSTLPADEVDNGLAEMVKHAVIADAAYLAALTRDAARLRRHDPVALATAIRRSIEIKAAVVAADTEERDLRQVLNLGHTIGHAIEAMSDFAVGHGRAVAAGLSIECGIAARLGLMSIAARDEVRTALAGLGLPTAPPEGADPSRLLHAAAGDKKGRAGRPRYALPSEIGRMSVGEQGHAREVPDEVVLAALSEVE